MRGRLCRGICAVGSVFGRIRFVWWRERDKGDERAAVQFVAFQRHRSEAGAGRLAASMSTLELCGWEGIIAVMIAHIKS